MDFKDKFLEIIFQNVLGAISKERVLRERGEVGSCEGGMWEETVTEISREIQKLY